MKRRITARPLGEAKASDRLLVAILLGAIAWPLGASSADAAALKWRPYRKPEIRAERADAVEPVDGGKSAVTHAAPTRQSLQGQVRQAAAGRALEADPLADPFQDGPRLAQNREPLPTDELEAAPSFDSGLQPLEDEATLDDPTTSRQPDALEPLDDYFPEERVPGTQREMVLPSDDTDGSTAPRLGDDTFDYNTAPSGPSDCKAEKADCADALAKLKSNTLANIDLSINVSGVEGTDFPCECPFGVGETFEGRNWTCVTYHWKASGLCHKPLYFEQVAVERYGHSAPTLVQDVLSGAHFFASIPALPYMMGLCPPDECQYSLGYYRPGNCAPYLIDPIPLSLRAGLFQAGAIAGGILIIP